jgi:uncharacterized membrane protein (UPF0127 family)
MSQRLAVGSGQYLGAGTAIAAILCLCAIAYSYMHTIRTEFTTLPGSGTQTLSIDEARLEVLVAHTPAERLAGLTRYKSMPPEGGMLFVYDESDFYPITAAGMHFPTDILWLDNAGKIVEVLDSVPAGDPYTHYPHVRARYILQINARTAARFGFDTSSVVTLPPIQ